MKMTPQKKAVDKIYKRRDRYEIPDWQRGKVWSVKKKQKLIDTMLRGWKLPKFYFLANEGNPDQFEVLDGQQRLSAIWDFFDGTLALSESSAEEFGAALYSGLTSKVADSLDDYEIEFDVIENATEQDQKEFFQRLQDGLPLTSSEKLNSVQSKLRDFCLSLSKHAFFNDCTGVSNRRYAYFDICAKCAAIEIEGVTTSLRYEDVKVIFEDNISFSPSSAVAKRLKQSLELLKTHLTDSKDRLKNRTTVQAVISLTAHLLKNGLTHKNFSTLAEFIDNFIFELSREVELGRESTDEDYIAFQRTVNANTRSGAEIRLTIMLKKLFKYRPSYFSELGATQPLIEGTRRDLIESSKKIRLKIKSINELHARKNGRDLFKATNKTAHTLSSLDETFSDVAGYRQFIENLYFVFRESVGTRLGESTPGSFSDVNELRTLNEHDLDHGKATKIAKKRKNLAGTYSRYFGSASPDTTGTHSFVIGHANLLAALLNDLDAIQRSLAGT